jgi:hypothetical protein
MRGRSFGALRHKEKDDNVIERIRFHIWNLLERDFFVNKI